MNLEIIEQATAEFRDAVFHYESIEPGLGVRFKQDVKSVVAWITNNAESPRPRGGGYRRVNLNFFPYYLAYTIEADTIWVLAIAHSARKPEYWIHRNF